MSLECDSHPRWFSPSSSDSCTAVSRCLIMELLEGGSYYQLLHAPHQFCSAIGPISLGFQEMLGGEGMRRSHLSATSATDFSGQGSDSFGFMSQMIQI